MTLKAKYDIIKIGKNAGCGKYILHFLTAKTRKDNIRTMVIILDKNALNPSFQRQKTFESEKKFNIYGKKSIKKMKFYNI